MALNVISGGDASLEFSVRATNDEFAADLEKMMGDLNQFRLRVSQLSNELLLNPRLDNAAKEKIVSELKEIETKLSTLTIAGIDTGLINQDINKLKVSLGTIKDTKITVTADTKPAEDSIESLKAKLQIKQGQLIQETDVKKIDILTGEIASLQNRITQMANAGKVGFNELGTAAEKMTTELDQFKTRVVEIGNQLTLNPKIDSAAKTKILSELKEIEDGLAKLTVGGLDTGPVLQDINTLKTSLGSIKETSIKITADTKPATEALADFKTKILQLVGQLILNPKLDSAGKAKILGDIKEIEDSLKKYIDEVVSTSKTQEEALTGLLDAVGIGVSPEIQTTIDKIKELGKEQERLNELISKTNEPSTLANYEKQLGSIQAQLEKMQGTLGQQVEDTLIKNITDATGAFDQAAGRLSSTFSQLRRIKEELATTSKDDPRYTELLKQATELQLKIKGVNKELQLGTSTVPGILAMKDGVRALVGGFEAAAGAISLFSGNAEEVEKATKNVIAAMGILNGIEEVGKVLEKDSALNTFLMATYRKLAAAATLEQAVATEAVAVAEGAEAVAAEGATVATVELNAAMAANPAGILLLAVGGLIAALTIFSSRTENDTESQTKHNKALSEANKILNELIELYNEHNRQQSLIADQAVTLAQAQGKSEKEVSILREHALKTRQLEYRQALATLGISSEDRKIAAIQIRYILEELIAKKEALRTAILQKTLNEDQLENLKSQVELLQGDYSSAKAAFDSLIGTDASIREEAAGRIKDAHAAAIRSDVAAAEARLLLVKKNTQEELNAQLAAIHERTKAELDNVNLTTGERQKALAQEQKDIEAAVRAFKILRFSNERELLQARLANSIEGSKEELDLKIGLINQAAAIEIEQEGITSEKKLKIRAEERRQINELIRKSNQDDLTNEINITVSGINARLSVIQQGSTDELELKRSLIDQKELLDVSSAIFTIKNEQLLQAKINEIRSKALSDQKRLNEEFRKKFLDDTFKDLERITKERNIPLNAVLQDPTSTVADKSQAQIQILQNQKVEVFTKILQLDRAMNVNAADFNEVIAKRRDLYAQLLEIINQINNASKKKEVDNLDDIQKKIGDIAGGLRSLATGVGGFNSALGESIGLLATVASGIQNSVGEFKKFKTATTKDALGKTDTLGAISSGLGIIGTVVSVISTVASIFKKAKEERLRQQKEIADFNARVLVGEQEINQLYRERLRTQADLNDLTMKGIHEQIALLKSQKDQAAKDYQKIFDALRTTTVTVLGKAITGLGKSWDENITQQMLDAGYTLDQIRQKFADKKDILLDVKFTGLTFDQLDQLFIKGQLQGKAKELFLELQKLKQEGVDIDKLIEEGIKAAKERATGTTANAIIDSIVEGFKQGKKSASEFAGLFEDLMKNAVFNALKFEVLTKPLKEFFEQFAEFSETDQVLTDDEVRKLRERFSTVIDDAGKKFEELKRITGLNFGIDGAKGSPLVGAIQGMTAQQADLLAGQFGGQRLATLELGRLMNIAIDYYRSIERNTALTVARLDNVIRKFDSYEAGTVGIKVRL